MASHTVVSRRGFLATVGVLAGTGVGTARRSTLATCHGDSAKQYWKDVTAANWGYTATGLEAYHDTTGDLGDGRRVLVIDNGFDTDHPLYNRVQSTDDQQQYQVNVYGVHLAGHADIEDQAAHGTAVTGILWQAAPKAEFYLAKKQRPEENSNRSQLEAMNDVISGLEYANHAEQQFDVVNISAGTPQGLGILSRIPGLEYLPESVKDTLYTKQRRLRTLTNDLAAAGTIVTAGAGNKADDHHLPLVPSDASGALSIASSTRDGTISRQYSPEFPTLWKPDLAAPGQDVSTIGIQEGQDTEVCETSSRYGSSFAAPFVAGVALLLSKYGTSKEVTQALETTAIDIPGVYLDGHGRISITKAHEELTGESLRETGPISRTDGFESGAYNDRNPVTWQVESPGEHIKVQSAVVKNGEYALEIKSKSRENNAILYYHAENRSIKDGDVFSVWINAEARAWFTLTTESDGRDSGPHSIRAQLFADRNSAHFDTFDKNGNKIILRTISTGSVIPNEWYHFELQMNPSQSEVTGRLYDSSKNLLGEKTLPTSGETELEYTRLHVPPLFGSNYKAWFDDVSVMPLSSGLQT